jgi:hypothetical protein
MGDQRGPKGPLFHGCAQSVLFTVFEKALFHGCPEGVLIHGLPESVLFTFFLKGRSSTVVQKARSPEGDRPRYSLGATACGIRRPGKRLNTLDQQGYYAGDD